MLGQAINNLKANAAKRTQATNTQSGLPPGFFDNHGIEKQNTGKSYGIWLYFLFDCT